LPLADLQPDRLASDRISADRLAPAPLPPAPSLAPPEGYTRVRTLTLQPHILQWVAPGALLLVFILSFFPWVGVRPGGVWLVSQSAWGTAFAGYSENKDLKSFVFPGTKVPYKMTTDKEVQEDKVYDTRPGASILVLFYLLLFLPALLITLACVVVPLAKVKLPPAVEQFWPWRWGIVAALNLVVFLFLFLQLMLNFSVEGKAKEWYDANAPLVKKEGKTSSDEALMEAQRGMLVASLDRTRWLWLAGLLQLIAIVAAALVFWIAKRGDMHSLPRLQLQS
jgi:hypothetical protein